MSVDLSRADAAVAAKECEVAPEPVARMALAIERRTHDPKLEPRGVHTRTRQVVRQRVYGVEPTGALADRLRARTSGIGPKVARS